MFQKVTRAQKAIHQLTGHTEYLQTHSVQCVMMVSNLIRYIIALASARGLSFLPQTILPLKVSLFQSSFLPVYGK